MRRIAQTLLPAAMALSIALTACAAPGGSTGPIDHPTGNNLVFRIEQSGGFVAPTFLFSSVPQFTMTGDGRIIVPGPRSSSSRGPRCRPSMSDA